MSTEIWTFEGYWNAVLGIGSAANVVREYGLAPADRAGLDEWLGVAEFDAWIAGNAATPMPTEWDGFHTRALDTLCAVETVS